MTEIEKSQYIKYKPQWILLVDSIKVKKEWISEIDHKIKELLHIHNHKEKYEYT
jgi:hypothetical protein